MTHHSIFFNFGQDKNIHDSYRKESPTLIHILVADVDSEIVKAKRATRERPISFTKMDDIKNRWETTSQQGRREVQREARKEEIAGIRSRLFMVNLRSFSSSFNRCATFSREQSAALSLRNPSRGELKFLAPFIFSRSSVTVN